MNVLITGAGGFIGKNVLYTLRNIRDGKDRTHPALKISKVFECYSDTGIRLLESYCSKADFVLNFAGVNRPNSEVEFVTGNVDFVATLLGALKKSKNYCPIIHASSVQASLKGRYVNSVYGKTKLESEELLFEYSRETNARVLIYRFPNVFGKWCRPNYNSVIATFCDCIARDLPVQVDNGATTLELLYIDDLINELLYAMEGYEHRCIYADAQLVARRNGNYCYVPITYTANLEEIVCALEEFGEQLNNCVVPEVSEGSFRKKLLSTFISYLPQEKMKYLLKMNEDERGSFTELIKTKKCGQMSVNILKPGITKGQHWHNSKWEIFLVVSGHGLIEERKIGSNEVFRFEVSGAKIEAIYMLPGYTHSITNLSDTEDLITVMWANETFNPMMPDTYTEDV